MYVFYTYVPVAWKYISTWIFTFVCVLYICACTMHIHTYVPEYVPECIYITAWFFHIRLGELES
jgi:hypothetical protein